VVQKLVAAGADTAAKANKGTTPLTVATLVNALDIVSFMTAHR
jgi:ankyrin repeat protein